MEWEEVIFAVGSVILAASLVPSVWKRQPPAFSTCVMTAPVLGSFVVAYLSLGYYFAASITLLATLMWVTLGAQRANQNRT